MAPKTPRTTAKKTTAKKTTGKTTKKATPKKPVKKSAPKQTAYRFGPGDRVPGVKVSDSKGVSCSLADFKGRFVVLYFYPKDNTPGCTLEGHDFKRLHAAFKKADCEILGVSRDSVKSHLGFRDKCGFPFELLADEKEELCRAFDVIQMKSLYGRKFEGIERSTFVIGRDGTVLKEWRKVKVNGHADEVLDFVKMKSQA